MASKIEIVQASSGQKTTLTFDKDQIIIDTKYRDIPTVSASCHILDAWNLIRAAVLQLETKNYTNNAKMYRHVTRAKAEANAAQREGYRIWTENNS